MLKPPNLSARIGVKYGNVVVGRCYRHFETTKPVSQDWGKIVAGRCSCHFEAAKPVGQNWGKVW